MRCRGRAQGPGWGWGRGWGSWNVVWTSKAMPQGAQMSVVLRLVPAAWAGRWACAHGCPAKRTGCGRQWDLRLRAPAMSPGAEGQVRGPPGPKDPDMSPPMAGPVSGADSWPPDSACSGRAAVFPEQRREAGDGGGQAPREDSPGASSVADCSPEVPNAPRDAGLGFPRGYAFCEATAPQRPPRCPAEAEGSSRALH